MSRFARVFSIAILASVGYSPVASAVTFGHYDADLLPEPPCAEGLDLVFGMLAVAAQRVAGAEAPPSPRRTPVPPGMVALPAGGVALGSRAEEGNAVEHPRHWVQLDAFALDRTEVTQGAYGQCVAAGKCAPPQLPAGATPSDDAQPVTGVRWLDAADFCAWSGKQLPTEAQWEYAARGAGQDISHPWGDELATCRRAWMTDAKPGCGAQRLTTPCQIPAGSSPQGICDLVGNVWEWTADWYAPYQPDAVWNPRGPAQGLARVVRGGSWLEFVHSARAAARAPRLPETRAVDLGFRCAAPLTDAVTVASQAVAPLAGDAQPWSPESSPHTDPGTGLRYIWLPGGSFTFGCEPSDSHCFADEKPGVVTQVDGFWLGEIDVTAAGYHACVLAGVCGAADSSGSCNARVAERQQHPANCVSAYQAEVFCTWAGARLPTAIEWEFAAKGGEGRVYPWGSADVGPTRTNYCDKRCGGLHPDWMWPDKKADDGWAATAPVGSFPLGASRHGLLDMVGNAAQWTATPHGVQAREVRGGGWDLYARYLRNSARTALPPSHWFDNVTIRCARSR